MSPVCRLEMTLPRGFPGGVWGDGSADERSGVAAARDAAGFGAKAADDGSGGPAVGARAASGVSVAESVPDRRSDRLNLEAAWASRQPAQARGAAAGGSDDHPPVVLGFWPDPGGREAARGSWDRGRSRNAAPVDDRSRAVAQSKAAQAYPPAASARECVGELVQVDGSEHWWFEDRGPQCTLLVFVDDATSRLMHLQFVVIAESLRHPFPAVSVLRTIGLSSARPFPEGRLSLSMTRAGRARSVNSR